MSCFCEEETHESLVKKYLDDNSAPLVDSKTNVTTNMTGVKIPVLRVTIEPPSGQSIPSRIKIVAHDGNWGDQKGPSLTFEPNSEFQVNVWALGEIGTHNSIKTPWSISKNSQEVTLIPPDNRFCVIATSKNSRPCNNGVNA